MLKSLLIFEKGLLILRKGLPTFEKGLLILLSLVKYLPMYFKC